MTAKARDSIQIFNERDVIASNQSKWMLVLLSPAVDQGDVSPGHGDGFSMVLDLPPSFSFTLCH
jgi:hypothetical protein